MPARTTQREALLQTIEQKEHLDNRFEGMQRIDADGGGGQFSLIVRARDRQTKKDVALKFFDPAQRGDVYRWESFKREAQLLPTFQGKSDILQCLCPLTEFKEPFQNNFGIILNIDFAYYAIELAEYDVNAAIINNRWNAEEKFDCFRAMCRGVQRLHRESMAHRDLKPSNGLVMSNGTFRLSDFGTARIISRVTNAIAIYTGPPGDMGYAAPEMFAALHDVDPTYAFKADMYALGAILFELFTGAKLNLQILDGRTLSALAQAMNAVPQDQRVKTYNSFVASLSAAHPLPSVSLFGTQTPTSIIELVDRLYRALAAIDYRDRLCDFQRVFMQIDRCVFVLKHEAAYRRWRQQKLLRKANSVRP